MNEELKQKAEEILLDILSSYDPAKEFISDKVPQVIEQLLTYNFTMSILQQIGSVVLFCIMAFISQRIFKKAQSEFGDGFEYFILSICVVLCLGVCGPLAYNPDWIKIWLAPDLYLLDYARGK